VGAEVIILTVGPLMTDLRSWLIFASTRFSS